MAQALCLQLTDSTTRAELQTSPSPDQIRLLRACAIVVILCLFFNRGGFGIDCLTEDLVASEEDGTRLYHRTRKGQHGVSAERKLLCHFPPAVHTEVIQMLLSLILFNALSREENTRERWAIDASEKHDKWQANTLT
jgi:hypothetical protein